jgi:hypothetical protein
VHLQIYSQLRAAAVLAAVDEAHLTRLPYSHPLLGSSPRLGQLSSIEPGSEIEPIKVELRG